MENIDKKLIDSIERANKYIVPFGIELVCVFNSIMARDTKTLELLEGAYSFGDELPVELGTLVFESKDYTYNLYDCTIYKDLGFDSSCLRRFSVNAKEGQFMYDECEIPMVVYNKPIVNFTHVVKELNSYGTYDKVDYTHFFATKNSCVYNSWNGEPKFFHFRKYNDGEFRSIASVRENQEVIGIVSGDEINEYMSKIECHDLVNSMVEKVLPDLYKEYSKDESKKLSLNNKKSD